MKVPSLVFPGQLKSDYTTKITHATKQDARHLDIYFSASHCGLLRFFVFKRIFLVIAVGAGGVTKAKVFALNKDSL